MRGEIQREVEWGDEAARADRHALPDALIAFGAGADVERLSARRSLGIICVLYLKYSLVILTKKFSMMKELHNAAGTSIGQTRAVSANMRFGPEEAENLWLTLYGSRAHAGKIASELDAIFRMTDTNDGCEYLFRIADNSDRILNLQAAALMHIETVAPSLPIPRVRTTLNGAGCSSIYGDDAKLE